MSIIKKIASALGGKKKQETKTQPAEGAPARRTQKKRPAAAREEWKPGQGAGSSNSSGSRGKTNARRRPSRGGAQRRSGEDGSRPEEGASADRQRGQREGDRRRGEGDGNRRRPPRKKPQGERSAPRSERPAAPKAEETPWDPAAFQVPPEEGKVRFHDLDLHPALMRGIYELGWKYCTPIQGAILPATLKSRDMAGRAQTGTGKTAAFLITAIDRFLKRPLENRSDASPRALVIAPTRELAMQIGEDAEGLNRFTGLRTVVLYGGMDFDKQQRRLERGPVDIVVATPGRLLDFENRRVVNLRQVEVMVIDEADRMLDMGFIPDVRRIIYKTPPKEKRQTLLFSATLTEDVMRLASAWMVDPERVDVEPEQVAVDSVDQQVFVTTDAEKFTLLYNVIKKDNPDRIIVFANRRDQTERLSEDLRRYGIPCEMLSGAVTQKRRMRILEEFKAGKTKVLVATDVAGRGIHVEGVSHVINFNIPENPDDYVHRIGRTGRAGATGKSITFACEKESFEIPKIEELLGIEFKCVMPEEEFLEALPPAPPRKPRSRSRSGGGGNNRRRPGNRPPPRRR